MRLSLTFFQQPTPVVAQALLGQVLVFHQQVAVITETEAYRGQDDPASHAYKGPTPRAKIMFGPAAMTYVYLIYGLHHCLNIVTEPAGQAGAVLIRGAIIQQQHFAGPGKLCRALGITRAQQGLDVTQDPDFYVMAGHTVHSVQRTARVGIKQGGDLLWRFVLAKDAVAALIALAPPVLS